MVSNWIRGPKEIASYVSTNGISMTIDVSALGGSVGTTGILTAKVIEVKSWAEFKQIDFGNSKNKIIFFNGAMDPTKIETFTAYLGAVNQRNRGAVEASKKGAIGVLIRSLTLSKNDIPHTGALTYELGITKIPAVAISTNSADMLSTALKNDNNLTVSLMMDCRQIPNVLSYNVIGEIKGTNYPNEIVTIGAHLDSWDVGEGASDNGTDVVQTIEALRLIKKTGN